MKNPVIYVYYIQEKITEELDYGEAIHTEVDPQVVYIY